MFSRDLNTECLENKPSMVENPDRFLSLRCPEVDRCCDGGLAVARKIVDEISKSAVNGKAAMAFKQAAASFCVMFDMVALLQLNLCTHCRFSYSSVIVCCCRSVPLP